MSKSVPTGNAVVAQSGGPTAVINQSLAGVVEGLRGAGCIGTIYGARHGVRGMTNDQFVDLSAVSAEQMDLVARTPSAALGSTRDKPDAAYCERIFAALQKRDVRYFFYIGGNDSCDTCRIVNELSTKAGYDLRCFHVPKTIDNDLAENDHTPGFPSAARFVAMATMGDNLDNQALPGIKINVIMGRHAGFLTAASILAKDRDSDGPHLVYTPEMVFDPEDFTTAVDRVVKEFGRCVVSVSEGIQDRAGNAIAATITMLQRERDAHGNIQLSGVGALGDFLAERVKADLTPKGGKPPRVRADTFGYMQRYWLDPSPVDSAEARRVGAFAAECALRGEQDGSIVIRRVSSSPYKSECALVKLEQVAAKTRHMPEEFIAGPGKVTPAFIDYLRPLVGTLPKFGRL